MRVREFQQQQAQGAQQLQAAQLENRQRQQDFNDQQKIAEAAGEWDGNDYGRLAKLVWKKGGSAKAVFSIQQHGLDVQKTVSAIAKDDAEAGSKNLETFIKRHQTIGDSLEGIEDVPDEQLHDQALSTIHDLTAGGIFDPQTAQHVTQQILSIQDPQALRSKIDLFAKASLGAKAVADKAFKEREVSAQEMSAQARMQQANKPPAPSETSLAIAASQGDPKAQAAQAELLRQHTAVAAAGAQASGAFAARQQGRTDKSYQFSSGQLDKVGQPIEAAVQRLGRLQDTLSQNTPQADALVAPELLTVMAGGQGSGLRMNEAEIARIVGGRSKWETLKAAVNQWQVDPNAARSITPAQQQQIRSLVTAVQQKLIAKQKALDDARQSLINSDDPTEHRRIVATTRNKLTQIDESSAGAGGITGAPSGTPPGATHIAPGSDGRNHYTNAKGQDLGIAP